MTDAASTFVGGVDEHKGGCDGGWQNRNFHRTSVSEAVSNGAVFRGPGVRMDFYSSS